MSDNISDPDSKIFSENVLALLDRANAIDDEMTTQSLRKVLREKAQSEDRAFLEYVAMTTKAQQAANVKESLQPFSAEARSNLDSINAMLSETGGTVPSGTLRAVAGGDFQDQGFTVDESYAVKFNQGRPMKQPPEPAKVDTTALAIENLDKLDQDEEDFLRDSPSMWSPSGAIGRRAMGQREGPLDFYGSAAGEHIRAILAPPPRTVTYAHELAHMFNMLESNNIVLVATTEYIDSHGVVEYQNKLIPLSPTNGIRLRQHLSTPPDQARLFYTSQAWAVRQDLLTAILHGQVDLEYISHLQAALVRTVYELKGAESLLAKRAEELCRSRTMYRNLKRATETIISKNRLRRALLLRLSLELHDSLHESQRQSRIQDTHSQPQHRAGAVLADFIARQEEDATLDESAVTGAATPVKFSSFEELQEALSAFDRRRRPSHPVGAESNKDHVQRSASKEQSMLSAVAAPKVQRSPSTSEQPTIDLSTTLGDAIAVQQAHDSLLRILERKVERTHNRINFERRMELMERLVMEAEETNSAVNTIFRFGDHGYARVRDILNSVPADILEKTRGSGMRHVPLAANGVTVVCPCCRFEFDPSKPASHYRDAIMLRQSKSRATIASKVQAITGPGTSGKTKPTSKSGKGDVEDDQLYAVMSLQEALDDALKHNRELEERRAELEATLEVTQLNMVAAQQNAQSVADEYTKANEELQRQHVDLLRKVGLLSKARDAAEKLVAELKEKLVSADKATDRAVDELELMRETDRKLQLFHNMKSIEDAVDGPSNAMHWEDVAKHFHRRFHEVSRQVRRMGGEPMEECHDAYAGKEEGCVHTATMESQYNIADAHGEVPFFADAASEAFPDVNTSASQTPTTGGASRLTAQSATQTAGIAIIMHALLDSEKERSRDSEWVNENGERVKSVLMRKEIYDLLLKANEKRELMREYIRILEKKDKEDAEKHLDELADAQKKHVREVHAVREDLAAAMIELQKLRARLGEVSAELSKANALNGLLKAKVTSKDHTRNKAGAPLASTESSQKQMMDTMITHGRNTTAVGQQGTTRLPGLGAREGERAPNALRHPDPTHIASDTRLSGGKQDASGASPVDIDKAQAPGQLGAAHGLDSGVLDPAATHGSDVDATHGSDVDAAHSESNVHSSPVSTPDSSVTQGSLQGDHQLPGNVPVSPVEGGRAPSPVSNHQLTDEGDGSDEQHGNKIDGGDLNDATEDSVAAPIATTPVMYHNAAKSPHTTVTKGNDADNRAPPSPPPAGVPSPPLVDHVNTPNPNNEFDAGPGLSPPPSMPPSSNAFSDFIYGPTVRKKTTTEDTTTEDSRHIQAMETMRRRDLVEQYASFMYPVPLIIELLHALQRHLQAVRGSAERPPKRDRVAPRWLHLPRASVGKDLDVSDAVPSWYADSALSGKQPSYSSVVGLHVRVPVDYQVLQMKEFTIPEDLLRHLTRHQRRSDHYAGTMADDAAAGVRSSHQSPSHNDGDIRETRVLTWVPLKQFPLLKAFFRDPLTGKQASDSVDCAGYIMTPHGRVHAFETLPQHVAVITVDGSQLPTHDNANHQYQPTLPSLRTAQGVPATGKQHLPPAEILNRALRCPGAVHMNIIPGAGEEHVVVPAPLCHGKPRGVTARPPRSLLPIQ